MGVQGSDNILIPVSDTSGGMRSRMEIVMGIGHASYNSSS